MGNDIQIGDEYELNDSNVIMRVIKIDNSTVLTEWEITRPSFLDNSIWVKGIKKRWWSKDGFGTVFKHKAKGGE